MAMQVSLDNSPVIVRSSQRTALWMLVVCILFVGVFILMLRDPAEQSNSLIAYAGAAFFGLGIPVFAARLLRPDTLEIGPSGLVWRSLFRSTSFRWRDVRNFRPYRPTARVRSPHIGFEFADDYQPERRGSREAVRQFTGVEGSLGGGWEIDAAELVDLLNAAQARWASSD
jgi:hypothetical protein